MNLTRTFVFALLSSSLMSTPALAVDAENGKKLYSERCGGCHDTKVHTRPNRIIHTYEDLVNRVRFCDNAAKANLTENDIYDVSEYLNATYYKFLKVKGNG
ncbi:MAG: cytochrome c [Gammaproteobacteria bacterium]|nr:cytochrome c [Gammaproteobacteria bacterium]